MYDQSQQQGKTARTGRRPSQSRRGCTLHVTRFWLQDRVPLRVRHHQMHAHAAPCRVRACAMGWHACSPAWHTLQANCHACCMQWRTMPRILEHLW